jgi:hypothetical protein
MYPAQVGLDNFTNIHEGKHGTDTFAHTVIAFPDYPRTGFAVSGNNVNTFHGGKLLAVPQVGYKTLLEPPTECGFSPPQTEEV